MRLRSLSCLAAALPFVITACSDASSSDDGVAGQEANYTSDGGDAETSADASTQAAVDVPAFTLADVASKPKLRFSFAGSAPVDAYEPEWTTVISGTDRRFQLQGATPGPGGKPVFYMEFGRGPAVIEMTTYDCASMQALVLVVDTEGKKQLTVVDGGAQRACRVVVDDVQTVQPTTSPTARPYYKVIGHVEAEVGPREDGAAPAKSVRATFAATVHESTL